MLPTFLGHFPKFWEKLIFENEPQKLLKKEML